MTVLLSWPRATTLIVWGEGKPTRASGCVKKEKIQQTESCLQKQQEWARCLHSIRFSQLLLHGNCLCREHKQPARKNTLSMSFHVIPRLGFPFQTKVLPRFDLQSRPERQWPRRHCPGWLRRSGNIGNEISQLKCQKCQKELPSFSVCSDCSCWAFPACALQRCQTVTCQHVQRVRQRRHCYPTSMVKRS